MFSSYTARLVTAVLLFGGTMAFALTAFLLAVVDLHQHVAVWENDMGYLLIAVTGGLLTLGVCHNLLTDRVPVETIPVEDLFRQD